MKLYTSSAGISRSKMGVEFYAWEEGTPTYNQLQSRNENIEIEISEDFISTNEYCNDGTYRVDVVGEVKYGDTSNTINLKDNVWDRLHKLEEGLLNIKSYVMMNHMIDDNIKIAILDEINITLD